MTVTIRARLERARTGVHESSVEPAAAARSPHALGVAPGDAPGEQLGDLCRDVASDLLARFGTPSRRVVNATGVFLHTNLGRAPLPRDIGTQLLALLDAGCDLELDLTTGRRGDRSRRLEPLLRELTGAAAGLAVNNNAAALVLALKTHAENREVVVARGELVEIGGGFRIPEILAAAGARLREVGTTNRTRLADYAQAIGPETAFLMKVHPSNYRVRGFVAEVGLAALADLGRRHRVPVLYDEGSGLLRRHPAPQLGDHLSLAEALAAGAALVCGSGDKLLGGPQAGLLLGRRDLIEACARHPLYRALRPGRAVLAALELVLRRHLVDAPLPIDGLWPETQDHLRRLAAVAAPLRAEIVEADAYVGGGAAPEAPIPGHALALRAKPGLAERLRQGDPPVIGYVRDGLLIFDLRTVLPADDAALCAAVLAAAGENAPAPSPGPQPR